MRKIIGRKVKIVSGPFYTDKLPPHDLEVTIVSVEENAAPAYSPLVNVVDGDGCLMVCFSEELIYLNNRVVKV